MVIGMMIFFLFFLGLLGWVYRSGANELHGKISQLPLKDEVNL
jgi:cbb3-type cytochrome oxidase subunit 3